MYVVCSPAAFESLKIFRSGSSPVCNRFKASHVALRCVHMSAVRMSAPSGAIRTFRDSVPRNSKTQILLFESTSGLIDGLASSALELWFLGLVLLSTGTFALRFSHDSPPKVHAVSECEPRSVGVLQMLVASSVAFLVSGDALPEPRCK